MGRHGNQPSANTVGTTEITDLSILNADVNASAAIAASKLGSTGAGITAGTTQTQAGGTALTATFNEVGTVANDEDGVTLPTAVVNTWCYVYNNGANLLKIWPATSDNLGKGVDTGMISCTGEIIGFFAYDATNWTIRNRQDTLEHTSHYSTGAGFGSSSTKIRRLETVVEETGTAIVAATSASLGTTYTVKVDGLYTMSYIDDWSGGLQSIGLSRNSNQLTTSIGSITAAHMLAHTVPVSGVTGMCSVTAYLAAGDVIRCHTGGSQDATGANDSRFHMVKVG